MKKIITIIILTCLFQVFCPAQYNPSLLAPLPAILQESSGIEVNSTNNIWTHNDSGDYGRIFNIDSSGNLLRTLVLAIDSAMDCEDITQDATGNYYIGDFGNNLNNRTDLRIYKIPNPDSVANDTVVPEIITFQYPDQWAFPPDVSHQNFDCEAMFHWGDSLYLFSKNRGTSTFSRMYRLPDQAGNYTAQLIDSINTGIWVTSADISPSGKNLILFSETQILLITNIEGTRFLNGTIQKITMDYTQKEGIVFVNDSLVYITDEKLLNMGGNLYKMNLSDWIHPKEIPLLPPTLRFYPNPARNQIQIYTPQENLPMKISIYDITGKVLVEDSTTQTIDISGLSQGIYIIKVAQNHQELYGKFVKE